MLKRPRSEETIRLLAPLLTPERREKIRQILKRRTRYVTLVLDDLYHQHNMSAVVRSCEAFGIQDLHVIELENRFAPSHGVAMGSQQWISILRHESVEECVDTLRNMGYRIFAADPPDKAKDTRGKECFSLHQLDLLEGPVAIALGKELDGLDQRLRQHAEGVVYIPMYGFTESLNVSVTAALFLYELRNKLQEIPQHRWQLTPEECTELEALWHIRSLKRGEQILRDLLKKEEEKKRRDL